MAWASSSLLLGGSFGNVVVPNAGAIIRGPPSVPGVLAGLVDRPMDRDETAESCEISDDADPRRVLR